MARLFIKKILLFFFILVLFFNTKPISSEIYNLTFLRFLNKVSRMLRIWVCVFTQNHDFTNKVSGRSEIGRVLSSKVSWTLACREALLENSFNFISSRHFVSKFKILCENTHFLISGKRVPRKKLNKDT